MGKALPYTPTKAEAELAINAAQILGVDFAGVDLLFGEDGPLLMRSEFKFTFTQYLSCTGINIADVMFDYMIQRTFKQ